MPPLLEQGRRERIRSVRETPETLLADIVTGREYKRLSITDPQVLKLQLLAKVAVLPIGPKGLALIEDATSYIIEVHKDDKRKDGVTPYAVHPLRIADRLAEQGYFSPLVYALALTHDVREKQGVTTEDIKARFASNYGERAALEIDAGIEILSNKKPYFVYIEKKGYRKKYVDIADPEYYDGIYQHSLQPEHVAQHLLKIKTEDGFDNTLEYIRAAILTPHLPMHTKTPRTAIEQLVFYIDNKNTMLAGIVHERPDLAARIGLATAAATNVYQMACAIDANTRVKE